jgi:putative endonuclease
MDAASSDEWFVYIVRCADSTLYTGIAKDVVKRVEDHNNNNASGAKYTRARRPVRLVYHEACDSHSHAARREYEIKQLSRAQKEALLATAVSLSAY